GSRHSRNGLGNTLDGCLDEGHELVGVGAVDDAMVEGQRKVRASPYGDRVLAIGAGHHLGPLFDRADAENRDLRLIDYLCADQRFKVTRQGEGEEAVLNVARVE